MTMLTIIVRNSVKHSAQTVAHIARADNWSFRFITGGSMIVAAIVAAHYESVTIVERELSTAARGLLVTAES